MRYQVRVVEDCDLGEVDWVFIRVQGGLQFWLKRSVAERPHRLEAALQDAWSAFRKIERQELLSWPAAELAHAG